MLSWDVCPFLTRRKHGDFPGRFRRLRLRVPRNSMCSRKWVRPRRSQGSSREPTSSVTAAAAESHRWSLMYST